MKPTKARIELMQAIADGAVDRHFPLGLSTSFDEWDRGPGVSGRRRRMVSARVHALWAEGLVKLLDPDRPAFKAPCSWALTPVGETWLKANGGTTS